VSELRLDGKPIDPARTYRVTVPSFLAAGGDSFTVLESGAERHEGAVDVDALTSYLGKISSAAAPFDPAPGRRITGDGCK
ncbi:MAG TPA: 5'-nucleotidase C-terminal domain-containing protein, partial [Polyangiaceae bacterium]|nr:5'-nucleotidase C-terminal domain-containing protein [Polyangiaceae bacterium]